MTSITHLIDESTIQVYWPEGCDPHTTNVKLENAETHIAARDRWTNEAMLLLILNHGDSPEPDWELLGEGDDEHGEWCQVWGG